MAAALRAALCSGFLLLVSAMVPEPQNVRITSVNLHSTLQWDAPRYPRGNLTYTVQSKSVHRCPRGAAALGAGGAARGSLGALRGARPGAVAAAALLRLLALQDPLLEEGQQGHRAGLCFPGGSGGHQAQLGGAGPAGAMDSVLCASAGADPRVEQDRAAEQGALRADNPQRCNPCVDHCDCSDGVHAGRGHSCHRLFLLQFLSVQTHQTCFLPFLHFPRTLERVSEQTPGAPQPLPPREELLVCDKLTVMAEQSQPSLKGLGTGPAGQQSSLRTLPKDTDSGVRKSPNILLVIPWTFGFVSLLLFSRKTPQANTASQTFDRIILFFKYKKLGSK
ncbi:interleukin-10 receptor subunit beta isoform X2 [Zonotrichia albicollis]|uniref:interleukin-10 receptor subunit beta isoform X2 n=1 Tax=Zonotrichia albicollis TaxID=44394 RepID=UPI003D80E664